MGTFVRKSDKVHLIMVLDESGSMYDVWEDTVGGTNSYFDGLKSAEDQVDYLVTIVVFSTNFRIICEDVPLSEVPKIDQKNYHPMGMTALYDAVGTGIARTEKKVKPGDKVLMVVTTDGQENSSKEYSSDVVRAKIEYLQKEQNWTFVYLGAVDNAWADAEHLGFLRDNVRRYHKSRTKRVFDSMSAGTRSFSLSAQKKTAAFYSTYTDPTEGIVEDPDA